MNTPTERVMVKVYMSRELSEWLTQEAVRRYGKERRRNDLIEDALGIFQEDTRALLKKWTGNEEGKVA